MCGLRSAAGVSGYACDGRPRKEVSDKGTMRPGTVAVYGPGCKPVERRTLISQSGWQIYIGLRYRILTANLAACRAHGGNSLNLEAYNGHDHESNAGGYNNEP